MSKKVFTEEKWKNCNKVNKLLLEDFVLEMKSNKMSIHTIEQYICDLRMIFCYIYDEMNNISILEMSKKDFRRIKMWMIDEREVSAARCNRVMSAIHSMLDFAEDDDDYEYDYNTSKKVKGLTREPIKEIVFLDDHEILNLREALRESEMYKHMALLDMLYDSAGRRREVFQIEREGLLERNHTNIVRGKRGKMFPLLYFSRSKESLALYLDTREDSLKDLWVYEKNGIIIPARYTDIYDWVISMREVYEDISGKYVAFTPHSFRHSCIENMKRGSHYICQELGKDEGFQLEELKVFAHHEDTGTTESYLKKDDNNVLENMFKIKLA